MPKQPTSFRLSEMTTRQLAALIAATGLTQSELMSTAIDRMYQQEIRTMNLTQLAKKFGTITHEGTEYTLAEVADYSNRLFTGWWGDAQEGEEYTAEFNARAYDADENEYRVYWQFETIKGEEPELDGYPWDDEHITRVVPQ